MSSEKMQWQTYLTLEARKKDWGLSYLRIESLPASIADRAADMATHATRLRMPLVCDFDGLDEIVAFPGDTPDQIITRFWHSVDNAKK